MSHQYMANGEVGVKCWDDHKPSLSCVLLDFSEPLVFPKCGIQTASRLLFNAFRVDSFIGHSLKNKIDESVTY